MTRTPVLICAGPAAPSSRGPPPHSSPAQRQPAKYAPNTFLNPQARTLFEAAQSNWRTVDESIVRYTALIKQRISASIRTPLKDRIIYRNETAVRAFWDRDYDAVVQGVGTPSPPPGRSRAGGAGGGRAPACGAGGGTRRGGG